MKIVLFLLGQKGYNVLTTICDKYSSNIIGAVIYGNDKGIVNDYSQEIIKYCKLKKISIFSRNENYLTGINGASYRFAIGWKWMILNTENLIILHDSLLPKYRGFAPLVNALINGDKQIGVSAIHASENYDCGDIIIQKSSNIEYPIKIQDAMNIVNKLYIDCVLEVIRLIFERNLPRIAQDCKSATYSLWRDQDDYIINWHRSSSFIKRFIDAVGLPYNGAVSRINAKKYIIKDAEVHEDVFVEHRLNSVGKVIFVVDHCPVVVCGDGLLKIVQVIDTVHHQTINFKNFRMRFR